jgi:peptidoglycan/LPS O-acetylase OafA/YrhL
VTTSAAAPATPTPTPRAVEQRAPTRLPRYEQLDAFRLVALTVIMYHTYQHSRGPSGFVLQLGTLSDSIVRNIDFLLSFYFILAGFSVSVQFIRPVLAGRTVPASRDFLIKRLARLVPLYMLVFLLVWELRYAGTERQWSDLLWGATLMQSWSTKHVFATIDPAWYLSVEINFVIVLAAILLPLLRRISRIPTERRRWQACIGIAAVLIVIGIAWKAVAQVQGVPYDDWGRWFAPPAWMDLWGLGMLFGMAVMRWDRPDRWAPRGIPLMMVVAALSWLWLLTVLADQTVLPRSARWLFSGFALLALLGASVMTPPERRTRKIMASKPIQTLAASSFGMFILHAPIMRAFETAFPLQTPAEWAASTLALIALTALLGFYTLRWIELPAQGLARIHLPERQRRWEGARPIAGRLRPGDPYPAELTTILGSVPSPGVVLVGPSEFERPPSQDDGTGIALATLQTERFAMLAAGGDVAAVIADEPARLRRRQEFDQLDFPVEAADGNRLAQKVGVGGLRQRWGAVVPARAAIVIDAGGIVRDVLHDPDGARLVRRAIDAAAPVAHDYAQPAEVGKP